MKRFLLFAILALSFYAHAETKKAYIITGPCSSGSIFIARVISYAVGKDAHYKQWDGFGLNGTIGDDILVMHRSQPYGAETKKFITRAQFHTMFPGYKLYFIIPTRDQNIQSKSTKRRFDWTKEERKQFEPKAQTILKDIIRNENCFIWSYEAQCYLKKPYFEMLYKFLEIESDFFPADLKDFNKKHIKK